MHLRRALLVYGVQGTICGHCWTTQNALSRLDLAVLHDLFELNINHLFEIITMEKCTTSKRYGFIIPFSTKVFTMYIAIFESYMFTKYYDGIMSKEKKYIMIRPSRE
jgi:hypothetical protein